MESNHSDTASSSSSATKQEGSSSQSQKSKSSESKSSSDKNSNPIYSKSNDESSKNEQEESKSNSSNIEEISNSSDALLKKIPSKFQEIFVKIGDSWATDVDKFIQKFNDISVKEQSLSEGGNSAGRIQLFKMYREYLRICRNGAKNETNDQEETKEIVDNDMKFAKNIIVTCDGSEEDGNSKYLTRNLVEECDRKLAFVMFK